MDEIYDRILIANDGSKGAAKALDVAIKLSHRLKARLHMISVEELMDMPATIDEVVEEECLEKHRFSQVIARAQFKAKSAHVTLETHLLVGHAVPVIVDFIERGHFDLLVIGHMAIPLSTIA
jgi:nucleotide-binding universal stress UspA family protein